MRILFTSKFTIGALCIILVLLTYTCSCRKDPPKPHPNIDKGTYYLGEVKDYLYFKPGSYWVYHNTVTDQYDTITQISIDTSMKECSEDLPDGVYYARYTDLKYVQYSSLLNRKLMHSTRIPAAHNFGYTINRTYLDDIYPIDYEIFIYPFHKPEDTNTTYSSRPLKFGEKYLFHSGTFQFDSAVQLRVFDLGFQPRSTITRNGIIKADHYWAKGYGLVKIDVFSFSPQTWETWELTDYKINR